MLDDAKMKEAFVSIAAPLMQIISPIVDILVPAFEMLSYILYSTHSLLCRKS